MANCGPIHRRPPPFAPWPPPHGPRHTRQGMAIALLGLLYIQDQAPTMTADTSDPTDGFIERSAQAAHKTIDEVAEKTTKTIDRLQPSWGARAAGPPPPASSRAPAPFHPTRGGLEPPMPVPLLWRGFHGRLVQRWANAVRAGPPIRQAQLEHNAHLRFQAFVALHVDRGEMDKHVGLTSRGLDEAIALFIAEPFDLPCLHGVSS